MPQLQPARIVSRAGVVTPATYPQVAAAPAATRQLVHLGPFFDSSASSGTNNYMILGASGSSGELGKSARVPFDCSLVALEAQQRVTAYTSGDCAIQVRRWNGSAWDTLVEVACNTTGTDSNQETSETWPDGDNPVTAGDRLLVRRVITSGGMTTDDTDVALWLLLDDPDDPGA